MPLHRGLERVTARKSPEELRASRAAANEKRKLRRLWAGELVLEEICDEMGMTEDELLAFAASLGLEDRPESDAYLPTPEEIRLAAAEIRSRWTPAELEARRTPWHGKLE